MHAPAEVPSLASHPAQAPSPSPTSSSGRRSYQAPRIRHSYAPSPDSLRVLMACRKAASSSRSSHSCVPRRVATIQHSSLLQPSDYPLSPFKMKFEPPILHPNGSLARASHSSVSDALQCMPTATSAFPSCIHQETVRAVVAPALELALTSDAAQTLHITKQRQNDGRPCRASRRSS